MKLVPHLLKEAEYRRDVWEILLEPGTTLDDMLEPAFWAHVARRLKPRSRIEVHANDGAWMAELIVRSAMPVAANVAVLHFHDFSKTRAGVVSESEEVEIKFRGPAKWSAIRKADKTVLTEGHDTREDVAAWLKRPVPTQAAA